MTFVSILTPAYKPDHFADALSSALAQTHPDFEHVICDDSGGDAIAAIVHEVAAGDPRVRYLQNPHTLGGRDNYLRCLELARGEYIKFLNDDDLLAPGCLARMSAALDARREVSLVTSYRQLIDGEGRALPDSPINRRLVTEDSVVDGHGLLDVMLRDLINVVGEPTTVMLRRADALAIKPHLFSFAGREAPRNGDTYLWASLLARGDAAYIIEALSAFRCHDAQAQRDAAFVASARDAWTLLVGLARKAGVFDPVAPRALAPRPLWPSATIATDAARGDPSADSEGDSVVSIIIPVFNKLALTQACLESLRAHTDPDAVEIIVVDNGSTDGSTAWLREREAAGELRLLAPGENLGFARGCNLGAQASAGRYLLFLNNDTEVTPGWLAPLVDTLDRDPTVGATGARLLFPDGTIQHAGVAIVEQETSPGVMEFGGRHIGWKLPGDTPGCNRPKTCQALTAACLLVRRRAFEAAGGYDEAYWNGNEDMDLCFKLGAAGWRLVYTPASVVTHHESQSGPERWRRVRENVDLLRTRWRARIEPDYLVDREGRHTPTGARRLGTYAPPQYRDPSPAPAGAKPTVSIVVLTWNALSYTQRCLASVLAHTDPRHEVVVVDNGSTDGTPASLADLAAREPERVRVHLNAENRGFAAGNNQGIALARRDHVLLLNSDTVVTEGWLERMLAVLGREPRAGLVGPVSNRVAGPQKLASVGYDEGTLAGLALFAAGRAHVLAGRARELLCAVGFCLLIRRRVLEEIGGLDEGFGRGNYEDTDYCLRAFLAGWSTMLAEDSFVHHFGSRSFAAGKVDYVAELDDKFAIFKRKWNLPEALRPQDPAPFAQLVGEGFAAGLHVEPLAAGPRLEPLPLPAWELDRRVDLAEDLFSRDRLAEAVRLLRGVLALRPDDPRAASDLAVVMWQQGEIAGARQLLTDVLARHPEHKDARHNLAAIGA